MIPHCQGCLPAMAHWWLRFERDGSIKQHTPSHQFKVWEYIEEINSPDYAIIRFTWWNSISHCYPKGNFGENQLLDGSMSLSPLYSILDIDLHVRTSSAFHNTFALLQPDQVKITIFRVPGTELKLKSFTGGQDRSMLTRRNASHLTDEVCFTFIALMGLTPKNSHCT